MQCRVFRSERVWARGEGNIEGKADPSPNAQMSAGQAGRGRPRAARQPAQGLGAEARLAGRLLGGTPDGVPERTRPRRRDRGSEEAPLAR